MLHRKKSIDRNGSGSHLHIPRASEDEMSLLRNTSAGSIGSREIPGHVPVSAPTGTSNGNSPLGRRVRRNGKQKDVGGTDGNFITKFILLLIPIVVGGFVLASYHERKQLEKLQDTIVSEQIEPLARQWEDKYSSLEEENGRLLKKTKEYGTIMQEKEQLVQQTTKIQNQLNQNQKRLDYLTKYKTTIQKKIQSDSKARILEK